MRVSSSETLEGVYIAPEYAANHWLMKLTNVQPPCGANSDETPLDENAEQAPDSHPSILGRENNQDVLGSRPVIHRCTAVSAWLLPFQEAKS